MICTINLRYNILINAHRIHNHCIPVCIPLRHGLYTHLTRPFLAFCVGGCGLRDYIHGMVWGEPELTIVNDGILILNVV